MPPANSLQSLRFRLTVFTVAGLAVYKLRELHDEPKSLVLATWAFEACCALWLFAACAALGRIKPLERLRVPAVLFGALYSAHLVLCVAAVRFFDGRMLHRYTLLDLDAANLRWLGSEWHETKPTLVLLAAALVLSLAARKARVPGPPALWLAGLAAATAAIVFVARGAERFPAPLWAFAVDVAEVRRHPQVRAPAEPSKPHPVELLDRSATGPVRFESRFKRVLVFVLEEATWRHFDEARAALPASSFFRRTQAHQHVYSRFFATNMDSRTGVLALLSSRFTPYEAYRDLNLERYAFLTTKPTLVDVMRDNGFFTAAASAQLVTEAADVKTRWGETILMTEAETKASAGRYLCINPYRFEDSCEDKVLLPRLYALLEREPKLFWFQHFAWGHIPDYSRRTGKSDVEYTSELLDELVAHLEEKGLADETLIVVTADHGVRGASEEAEPATYQVPLLFYAPSLEGRDDTALHSQIDFKDLLLATLTGATVEPAELVLFIGPTWSSIVGGASRDGEVTVMKNRPFAKYAIAGPPRDDLLVLLEDYRRYFQSPEFR